MKNTRTFLACLLALGVVALHGTARAEEKKAVDKDKLVGMWEAVKADPGTIPVGSVVEFTKDGKSKLTVKEGDKEKIATGTYTVGDTIQLTMTHDGQTHNITLKVLRLTADDAVFENQEGKSVTFRRKRS
jgi:uncharacterized protein (TIGR03066 family)